MKETRKTRLRNFFSSANSKPSGSTEVELLLNATTTTGSASDLISTPAIASAPDSTQVPELYPARVRSLASAPLPALIRPSFLTDQASLSDRSFVGYSPCFSKAKETVLIINVATN
jgi:hypothetical protein